jgi:tetratricopeptide (TPR) repeat protein
MIIITDIDLGQEASRMAAEGQAALNVGETDRAREKFGEAGDLLQARIVGRRKAKEKHYVRFLAASQYYHGGHYAKARELARQVERRHLPAEAQTLFDKFIRDVNERADPGYEPGVRKQLHDSWLRGEYDVILKVLREHPYVLRQARLAYYRANCLENVKDYPAAAVFFADAIRWTPDDPELIYAPAEIPLVLAGRGKLEEAWNYVECQLKEIPHAITFITASIVRFHQANKATHAEEGQVYHREQFDYHREAWRRFQQLPPLFRDHPDLRDYMANCFEMTALGLHWAGDKAQAVEVCDAAIDFAPAAYGPRTIRAMITYPGEQALADCREAIKLGEPSYYPYYYLAHAALVTGDEAVAGSWCREALEHQPSRRIEAQLWVWLAVAETQMGKKAEDVRALLQKAQALDPGDLDIRRIAGELERSLSITLPDYLQSWGKTAQETFRVEYPSLQEARVLQQREQAGRTRKERVFAVA